MLVKTTLAARYMCSTSAERTAFLSCCSAAHCMYVFSMLQIFVISSLSDHSKLASIFHIV